jgi:hypothetical protein
MNTLLILFSLWFASDTVRTIEYNGTPVKTTFGVDEKFIGQYSGRKKGFLQLNADGTGEYNYDVFGFASENCDKEIIAVTWGFLLDENNEVVSFDREYGRSYPILFQSDGGPKFQGCRIQVLLDFIMEYEDGKLGVSSSDDWIKN